MDDPSGSFPVPGGVVVLTVPEGGGGSVVVDVSPAGYDTANPNRVFQGASTLLARIMTIAQRLGRAATHWRRA
jgi:hypothetical protein